LRALARIKDAGREPHRDQSRGVKRDRQLSHTPRASTRKSAR
jgi:hypothetical protein